MKEMEENGAMNVHLFIIALGVSFLGTAQADNYAGMASAASLTTEQHAPDSPAKNNTPAIALSSQPLGPADNTKGLRIDYQPFDSNFSMSAGSFHNASKDARATRYNNKAYLGVGWKKMIDQARLGMRVDFGAVYENNEGHNLAAPAVNGLKSISKNDFEETETSRWQPVISFGVSYRF